MMDDKKIHYERILIIDDEDMTRMMIRRVLEDAGYSVLEAADGLQGVEICRRQRPDAVLMDVRMPVMNGYDACRAIRQEITTCHMPILMLTSLDDVVAVQIAFDAGATDFITKPINWAILSHRVRYILRASNAINELAQSQRRLSNAQRIGDMGDWEWDSRRDRVLCSDQAARILARSPAAHLAPPSGNTATSILTEFQTKRPCRIVMAPKKKRPRSTKKPLLR